MRLFCRRSLLGSSSLCFEQARQLHCPQHDHNNRDQRP
jgi:hypothetical protein